MILIIKTIYLGKAQQILFYPKVEHTLHLII